MAGRRLDKGYWKEICDMEIKRNHWIDNYMLVNLKMKMFSSCGAKKGSVLSSTKL